MERETKLLSTGPKQYWKQGVVGGQGGVGGAVLCSRCAWVKRFPRLRNAEWRRAGNRPCPTKPAALRCSPAPNNKLPRDLISSWLR